MTRRMLLFVAVLASACGPEGTAVDPSGGGPDSGSLAWSDSGAGSEAGAYPAPPPTVDAGSSPTPGPAACPAPPCAARPIIFVHGLHGGSNDFEKMMKGLLANDARFGDYTMAGVADHQGWAPRSLARRAWLFSFDYYVKHAKTDKEGSYTAGPGRIGSNDSFACSAPNGKGYLVASNGAYDKGFTHEYARDLANFVESVLRATGAKQVDIVAHSMGGMITRSYLAFFGGAAKVKRLLLLGSPIKGVWLVGFLGLFPVNTPSWMRDHEIAELDGGSLLTRIRFARCAVGGDKAGAFGAKLLDREKQVGLGVELHVMSGTRDIAIGKGTASHPLALSHQTVSTDHAGLLEHSDTRARVSELLGGSVDPR